MHSNPLVATGVIPANLYNSFMIPEMNQPKQKPPQVVTKCYKKKANRRSQTKKEG